MWINKVWLDKIGKDIPKTTDEFYEVLKAFRDNDMDGDGDTTDEIPFGFCAANNYNIINLANSFGIVGTGYGNDTYYWEMHDGKVEATADTAEYRQYLEFAHKLASEGLLSLEGYTDTYEQYTAKLAEGRIGCFYGWAPKTDSCGNPDEFVPMLSPQGIPGVPVEKTGYLDKEVYRTAGLVISAECENPEAVLHWWNWLAKDVETKYRCRWGNFYYDENGQIRNNMDPALRPEGVSASVLEYTYGMGNQTSPYIGPHDYMQKFDENDKRHQFYDQVKDLIPAGVNEEVISSKAVIAPEAVEERTFLETDLLPMMNNFAATAIADGVTDAAWDQYLKDLKTYGYYEWLQWYQDFADGVI
jgi:ABC-type glycerol-3-phosphate transport system substrate-binding protein